MPSTNGHGPKRAILYARVSTDEQARSGYSLAQQLEALREYAAREGYELLEEVSDPGQSGASLERPGMDRVRDLVAAGGVSVVLAQDRDRFAREPAYHYLLRREFEEYGTKIRALNDRGDDTPEGDLTDGIMDQLAKYERAKIAERTRRGKLRKAREGKVVATTTPDYGFEYNATRDGYVVNPEKMLTVRHIFEMVANGSTLYAAKRTLDAAGTPSPTDQLWNVTTIREIVADDVYRPHTVGEIEGLVSPEVAARLEPEQLYGVFWFNTKRRTETQVAEAGPNGRSYKRKVKTVAKPREEWIAVPVPDAGIPRELVDTARATIGANARVSSAGERFWELSGGIVRCGLCGRRMSPSTTRKGGKTYHYYRCDKRWQGNAAACSHEKHHRADRLEQMVWEFVSNYLKNPERLRTGLEQMVEEKRKGLRGDPEREARAWLDKLAEADKMRAGYQELAVKGLMTFEELGVRLEELEDTRRVARRELEALEEKRAELHDLEQDISALLASYTEVVPGKLDNLGPEGRHHVYKVLRLGCVLRPQGPPELADVFAADGPKVRENEGEPPSTSASKRRFSSRCWRATEETLPGTP
jgi:site-specific DNA recombinase